MDPSKASTRGIARTIAFVALWLLVGAAMAAAHVRDGAPGGARPLVLGALATSAELALVLWLVRPWSYHRAWWRTLGATFVFAFASIVGLFAALHTGPIASIHALWLMTLTLALALATAWSLLAALSGARTSAPSARWAGAVPRRPAMR